MKTFLVSCLKATGIDSSVSQVPCAPDRHSAVLQPPGELVRYHPTASPRKIPPKGWLRGIVDCNTSLGCGSCYNLLPRPLGRGMK